MRRWHMPLSVASILGVQDCEQALGMNQLITGGAGTTRSGNESNPAWGGVSRG
jgi:hypothetical protein